MEQIGAAALPVIIGVILLFGFFRGVDVFDAFLSGGTPAWTGSIQNGAGEIQAALVDMVVITADNLKSEIIDAGIFSEAEIYG